MLIVGLHLHIHLLHHVHGPAIDYLGVGLAAFASWVGVPGPGEPVLIAAGVFAARHKLDISPVLLAAWVGATIGGVVGWLIGMKAGRSVLTTRGPFHAMRLKAVKRGEEVFKRVEVLAIVLTPSWVAGINRAGAGVYLATNAVSAMLLWAVPIGLAAYYAGPPVLDLVNDEGVVLTAAAVLLIGVPVGIEIVRRRRRRARARQG